MTYARTISFLFFSAFVISIYLSFRVQNKKAMWLFGAISAFAGCYWFINYFLTVPD
jgi:hypothetical protein